MRKFATIQFPARVNTADKAIDMLGGETEVANNKTPSKSLPNDLY